MIGKVVKKRGRPPKQTHPVDPFSPNKIEDRYFEEYQKKNLKEGDMVSITGFKTMGMLLSEPVKTPRPYNKKDYYYQVSVQLFKEYGKDCTATREIHISMIKKFHAWPYFYKKTPKQLKESALNSSESVV